MYKEFLRSTLDSMLGNLQFFIEEKGKENEFGDKFLEIRHLELTLNESLLEKVTEDGFFIDIHEENYKVRTEHIHIIAEICDKLGIKPVENINQISVIEDISAMLSFKYSEVSSQTKFNSRHFNAIIKAANILVEELKTPLQDA